MNRAAAKKNVNILTKTRKTDEATAVVVIGGKQYIVRVGDVFDVEGLNIDEGKKVSDFPVLFYGKKEVYLFGTPVLPKSKVEVLVEKNFKGKKIDVIKFKAKSRYSKKIGYRPLRSKIRVLKVTGGEDGS